MFVIRIRLQSGAQGGLLWVGLPARGKRTEYEYVFVYVSRGILCVRFCAGKKKTKQHSLTGQHKQPRLRPLTSARFAHKHLENDSEILAESKRQSQNDREAKRARQKSERTFVVL